MRGERTRPERRHGGADLLSLLGETRAIPAATSCTSSGEHAYEQIDEWEIGVTSNWHDGMLDRG
jgi:hypothetical protein